MGKQVKPQVTQKDVARYILDELGISRPYVLDFEANETVCLFEGNSVRRIVPGSELDCKLKLIEQQSKVKVYAVTHDYAFPIGEMYSFLCVSNYPEDFDGMLRHVHGFTFLAYAYVQNVEDDLCSEFGYVELQARSGHLLRVG